MRYRERPFTVEAIEWQPNDHELRQQMLALFAAAKFTNFVVQPDGDLLVWTGDGPFLAHPGDYVLKEFAPRPDRLFAVLTRATFELKYQMAV